MNIKEMPVDERPREKMLYYGKEALSNSELLALVIGTGTKEKTAVRLADELLALDSGGLAYLQGLSCEELSRVKGIGKAKAAKILAALELGKRMAAMPSRSRCYLGSSGEAAAYFMEKLRYERKESFCMLLLDTKGGIIGEEQVSVGDMSSSIVHPRETFLPAVRRGAYGVIFVHNHPSGDPTPSREDLETTARLCEAGSILGIRVMDHVIIGDGTFRSLRADGVID